MSVVTLSHKQYVQRLYKQALRTAFDHHSWHRDVYRQHCLQIRARFEENRLESNPIRIQALIQKTEQELNENRHPRPFIFPTSPGGVKHYRNMPLPAWIVNFGQGNWDTDKYEFEKIK